MPPERPIPLSRRDQPVRRECSGESSRPSRLDQKTQTPIACRMSRVRLRSQVAKAADCKSAIVGSTPTGASHQKTLAIPRKRACLRGSVGLWASHSPADDQLVPSYTAARIRVPSAAQVVHRRTRKLISGGPSIIHSAGFYPPSDPVTCSPSSPNSPGAGMPRSRQIFFARKSGISR